ncbi:MAG: hypothetical protein M3P48_03025 [Actinomycetota bacterium]|nr:hypothetical protein [Actinomycetota bacterium]
MNPVTYQPSPVASALTRVPERGPVTAEAQKLKVRWTNSRQHLRNLYDEIRAAQGRLKAAERARDAAVLREDQALTDGGPRPDAAELRELHEAVRLRTFERDDAVARHNRWVEEVRDREVTLGRFVEVRRLEIGAELMPAVAEAEQRVRAALRELQAAATALEDAANGLDAAQSASQAAGRVGPAPVPPQHRSLGDVLRDAARLAPLPLILLPAEYQSLGASLGMTTRDEEDRHIPATDLRRTTQRVVMTDGGAPTTTETDVLALLTAQLADGEGEE